MHGQGFPDRIKEVFGVEANQLPSATVETEPGDVIALNFRTVHASFLGAQERRLININYREPPQATGTKKSKWGFLRSRTKSS